jgi:hypothetical protein
MIFWVRIWILVGFSENLNTGYRIYGFMVKKKITVSVDKNVVDTAKIALLKKGRTLSDFIEKSLRSLSTAQTLDDLCRELGLNCKYVGYEEVERKRPDLRGKVASEVEVREIRRERFSRVL